jgi:hypothetical protein
MVQDKKKVSFRRRWNDAQPTKAVLFWSVVAAIILTMIVGFNWGGWVTGGTARRMAEVAAKEAVVERLALICVDQFNQDPEKAQKLSELNEKSSYQRDDYVTDQGWATMFGDEKPDRNVANACAKLIAQIDQE